MMPFPVLLTCKHGADADCQGLAPQTAAQADLKAASVREKHAAAELARLRKDAAKQDSASAKLEQVH